MAKVMTHVSCFVQRHDFILFIAGGIRVFCIDLRLNESDLHDCFKFARPPSEGALSKLSMSSG